MDGAPVVEALTIQTLGRFHIRQGKTQLPDTIWKREKARTLFQYFITYHSKLTAKERIIGDLWPQLSAPHGERDFKVALNALNRALQPDRSTRSLSVFIVRQGTSYGLSPDAPMHLDFIKFEAKLTNASQTERGQPETAISFYRDALTLYQGEYLPDTIYHDWTTAARERLTSLFLTGATRLAALLLDTGEQLEAILWCQRVLDIDACWEEAYRLLMSGYMASGNRPMAVRAYESCQAALADELGLEPMPETTRLYHQILNLAA